MVLAHTQVNAFPVRARILRVPAVCSRGRIKDHAGIIMEETAMPIGRQPFCVLSKERASVAVHHGSSKTDTFKPVETTRASPSMNA